MTDVSPTARPTILGRHPPGVFESAAVRRDETVPRTRVGAVLQGFAGRLGRQLVRCAAQAVTPRAVLGQVRPQAPRIGRDGSRP